MISDKELRQLTEALSLVRNSLESASFRRGLRNDHAQSHYLKFEAVRFRFGSRMRSINYPAHRRNLFVGAVVRELHDDLKILLADKEFEEFALEMPAIPRRFIRAERNDVTDLAVSLDGLLRERPPVFFVLELLRRATEGGVYFEKEVESELPLAAAADEAKRLRKIVPAQKVAPVQFDIVDDRLIIVQEASKPREEGAHVLPVARDELLKRGQEVISQLRSSNCDRRLLQQFEDLQHQIEQSDNIIQVGLTNIVCTMMSRAYEEELPSPVSALMQAHTVGVGMYVAQFPDWVSFSEQAVAAHIEQSDFNTLSSSLGQIIEITQNSPELAAPEVPRTLRYLKSLIEDPAQTSKRAVYAAARTLENLIIRVFQHGADFLDKTVSKTVDSLSGTASRVLVAGLLSLALSTAAGLNPLAARVEGMGWIKDAVRIVQRQIDTLKE